MGIGHFFLQTEDATSGGHRVLSDTELGLFGLSRYCLRVCADLPAQERLLVVIGVGEGTLSRRIGRLFLLRARLALVRRMLLSAGLRIEGSFAVSPDTRAPSLIYRLGGGAERYSRECLTLRGNASRLKLLRRLGTAVSGCDPSVGAIVMIAGRHAT
jgi:hypothetical protein